MVGNLNAKGIGRKLLDINHDPSLLPIKVRSFIVVVGFGIAWIILYSHAGFRSKLSACGILLGVFGSGILYWETAADKYGLKSVSNEIIRSSGKGLSFSDTGMVITLIQLGIVQFFLFLPPWFANLKVGQNGLWTSLGVSLTFAVFVSPAIATYLLVKLLRYWSHVWSRKFQIASEISQEEMTKRFLRTFGFASLSLSGIMQLPAALV